MLHLHVAPTTFHKQAIIKQVHWSMLHTHVAVQQMHKWDEWCSCLWNASANVEAKHLGCYTLEEQMQYNRRTLQELGLILYDSSNQVCICLIIIHYFQKAYMYLNDLYMCLHDNNLLLKPQKMQLMQNLAGTTSQVEVIVSNNSTKSLITTHKTIFLNNHRSVSRTFHCVVLCIHERS
jgi:hypothetical protein